MLAKAGEFNCGATDTACLCKNDDFKFGVRDCAYQSCGDDQAAAKVVAWGEQFCASNGGGGGGSVSRPSCEYPTARFVS
jgi:hypothetical protein